MEDFYTIQGEGFNTGMPAYFIRLGGCDVGCVWCDVKESWDASAHPHIPIDEIVERVVQSGSHAAVITGGEPLMHDLEQLCQRLHENDIRTILETSGSKPLSGKWDWICVSPKKFLEPLPETVVMADELKMVVYHPSDFAWAEKHASFVSPDCKLYLQPEWDRSERMLPLIIDYVKRHHSWKISLQTHKYMNIP
jgi:organic radical activating enzyme